MRNCCAPVSNTSVAKASSSYLRRNSRITNLKCNSCKISSTILITSDGVRTEAKPESRHSNSLTKSMDLSERLFAAGETGPSLAVAAVVFGGAATLLALGPEPAQAADLSAIPAFHPVSSDLQNLAAQEDFWVNLSKYFRFFISLMTGTAYVMLRPFAGMLKRPVTAVLLVVFVAGLLYFLNFTVNAMLGLSDPVDYQLSAIQ
uniref:Uncharacterized protein ycf33 n=1 Tax=Tetraselmis sp. GSL018 TaxID=582737 RepID=A0A061S0P0_9CHLO|mmetsp:Transcript_20495/g.48809  ORF Transcript_20495/g.48809 Transcript_20495/m.48809 type:complete len:203 (-) Transcript_20495:58-666(-)